MQYINKKYLENSFLSNLSNDLDKKSPVQYIIIDNFIDPLFFDRVNQLFEIWNFTEVHHRKESFISNRTVYTEGELFFDFFDFFQSQLFTSFLSSVYKTQVQRHKLWSQEAMMNKVNASWPGAFAQLYSYGDYMSWHTDLAKDMKRDKVLSEGGYSKWHKYRVSDYEEVWAFTYYLYNSDETHWDHGYGWNLEIWECCDGEMRMIDCILPKKNRLVLIKSSNTSYHRVSEIVREDQFRLSFQDLLQIKR